MKEVIENLAGSLIAASDDSLRSSQRLPGNLQDSYRRFLSLCDGGYTKDHFFHFFGLRGPPEHNVFEWNRTELWKKYFGLDDKTFAFAEDILGTQFFFDVRGNRRVVKMLVPGSGKSALCANSFEEFVEHEVLSSTTNMQARQLAENFFATKGESFRPFSHIGCKVPPALGGSDSNLENLVITRASTNLKLLGQVSEQIKMLAPGTRIREVKIDHDKEVIELVPERVGLAKRLFC